MRSIFYSACLVLVCACNNDQSTQVEDRRNEPWREVPSKKFSLAELDDKSEPAILRNVEDLGKLRNGAEDLGEIMLKSAISNLTSKYEFEVLTRVRKQKFSEARFYLESSERDYYHLDELYQGLGDQKKKDLAELWSAYQDSRIELMKLSMHWTER